MNKIEWKQIELEKILDYEQPTKFIVQSEDYSEDYETPVLTAGKSFYLGKTNEKEGIFTNLPVIIFDDFTTANKFVNFKFKVKSSAMKLLTPKNKNISLKYVFLMIQNLNFNATTHKRYYLSQFSKLKIPLPHTNREPDLELQQQIVEKLELAEKLKENRKNADELTKNYLNSVFLEMFGDPRTNPKGFEMKKIGQYLIKTKTINPEKEFGKNQFKYIDIGSVSSDDKFVKKFSLISGLDAPSRARREVLENDIIVSTVRPNLNSVGIIGENLNKNICSTGFHILRVNSELNNLYLYHICKTQYFIDSLMKVSKGANYPAVSGSDIENLQIPLPPIELQTKFAQIVEEVEQLKEYQQKSGEEIENLYNKLLQDAFRGEI
ncbi:MAG: restriction endonuclease subunit S [Nanoarchaeota archaeon]|nr:restriction endonuclease subunit S [Nanoarchaeota archaeon]